MILGRRTWNDRYFLGPLVALGLLTSCSGGSQAPPAKAGNAAKWAYEREFNQGAPVSLILRLDRTEGSLSDRLTLEEELRVEDGFEADFPEYLPEDFEGFSVVEIESHSKDTYSKDAYSKDVGSKPDGPPARRKRLTLEPDQSGSLAVAPLAVYFHRAGEAKESSFLTDEIPVQIAGIEGAERLELKPLRGIFEAPPAEGRPRWLLWAAAGAASLLAAGAAGFVYLRRGPGLEPAPLPPHEIAYEALRRLAAMRLIEQGQIELFFVHLSNILREYIEARFRVHAPELTTEEFLELAAQDTALASHRPRLGQFLELCDRVKFARFEPDEATIQESFDVLKQFLAETTEVEKR